MFASSDANDVASKPGSWFSEGTAEKSATVSLLVSQSVYVLVVICCRTLLEWTLPANEQEEEDGEQNTHIINITNVGHAEDRNQTCKKNKICS